MATIRFKPEFLKPIINPRVIDAGMMRLGHFKDKTTRIKPKKLGEYEIICGIPPRPLYNQMKTGILVEITEVHHKAIKDYSEEELIGDVGHCDTQKFVDKLNLINKARKTCKLTSDWQGYLHYLKYKRGGEDVDGTLKEIDDIKFRWAMFQQENPNLLFGKLCKMFAKQEGM